MLIQGRAVLLQLVYCPLLFFFGMRMTPGT